MDPYEVLSVSKNSSWKDIRSSYKQMLLKTHPDKLGDNKLFTVVQKAYKHIKEEYKTEQSYPTKTHVYSTKYEPKSNFNLSAFNKVCDQYAEQFASTDPFLSGGYSISKSLSYQEDQEKLLSKRLKTKKNQLVIHKEPEALVSSKNLENLFHLGVNSIDNFSCSGGTDYMQAYSEDAPIIDHRQQNMSFDKITEQRANQSFILTQEERKYSGRQEKKKKTVGRTSAN